MSLLVARALEEGWLRGPASRALSQVWGALAAASVVRPLPRPAGLRVVVVGGATLGGSGCTPLAIACAVELARAGARVAFVGHAYGARPGRARVVSSADPVELVGDESLVAARALEALRVSVVVAPDRASAVAAAATRAEVVVVDGPVQTSPRADLALLAVDAAEPWGRAGRVPPGGDLRAPRAALEALTDRVVRVGDGGTGARPVCDGVTAGGAALDWQSLARLRVGLGVALARPERLLRHLARRGVVPQVVVRGRDHGAIPRAALEAASRAQVDVWVATAKCALHWPEGVPPPAVLGQELALSTDLVLALRAVAARGGRAP